MYDLTNTYRVISSLAEEHSLDLYIPPPSLCTDNGVMIAWNAIEKLIKTGSSDSIGVKDKDAILTTQQFEDICRARWPLTNI